MVLRRERLVQCEAGRRCDPSCGNAFEAQVSRSTRAPRIPSLVGVAVNTTRVLLENGLCGHGSLPKSWSLGLNSGRPGNKDGGFVLSGFVGCLRVLGARNRAMGQRSQCGHGRLCPRGGCKGWGGGNTGVL